ncbi:MAG: MFS transporter [Dehalococcoidia bacterium]|nr:MFS transporter [Dehalococcoidia bacterium]
MADAIKTSADKLSTTQQPDLFAGIKQPAKIGTFYSITLRNFRLLWIGSLFLNFSQWVQTTTLSSLVYDMTGSGTLLQTINSIRSFPNLVVSPVSGLIADRVDRRKFMIYAQLPLLMMTLIMGILLAFGLVKVWHLMVFAILSGIPAAVNQPVRSSVTPMIVPRFAMPNAVALNSGVFTFTRIIGPAAAGLLLVLSPATLERANVAPRKP